MSTEEDVAENAKGAGHAGPGGVAGTEARGVPLDWFGGRAGVPAEDYHRRVLGEVSTTALLELARSPAHYLAWVKAQAAEADEETSKALAFGKAFHASLLEPAVYDRVYAVKPSFGDCRKKENKANRDAWLADHEGMTFVSADDHAAIRGMTESIFRHPKAAVMLAEGHPEYTVRWKDPETGLACKCRADWWTPGPATLVDLKTTADASPEGFARSVARYSYHVQAALYLAGFATGSWAESFAFVAIEKVPPYACAVYELAGEALDAGGRRVRRGVETMAACLRAGSWPGYATSVQTLELPPWAA